MQCTAYSDHIVVQYTEYSCESRMVFTVSGRSVVKGSPKMNSGKE